MGSGSHWDDADDPCLRHDPGDAVQPRIQRERFERPPAFYRGMINLVLTTWIISGVAHRGRSWRGPDSSNGSTALRTTARPTISIPGYTTVGSQLNLPLRWRLLEGMVATAGLWDSRGHGRPADRGAGVGRNNSGPFNNAAGDAGNQVEPGGMVPSGDRVGTGAHGVIDRFLKDDLARGPLAVNVFITTASCGCC